MNLVTAVRKKPLEITYVKFETNNESGSPHMDALVNWVNKSKPSPVQEQFVQFAWHNGTDIFLQSASMIQTVRVGEYIVKNENEKFTCHTQSWINEWNGVNE